MASNTGAPAHRAVGNEPSLTAPPPASPMAPAFVNNDDGAVEWWGAAVHFARLVASLCEEEEEEAARCSMAMDNAFAACTCKRVTTAPAGSLLASPQLILHIACRLPGQAAATAMHCAAASVLGPAFA